MSERLGSNNESFGDTPERPFYAQRKAEILGEMQQVLYDTLVDLGGQEALDFLSSMNYDLTVEENKMPTLSTLVEIEQFFPGFWPAVREKWQPLLLESRLLHRIELRRVRAKQDREILQGYETTEES